MYDSQSNQPTQAYSATEAGTFPYADPPKNRAPEPTWGSAPTKPPALNVTGFSISAFCVTAAAAGLAWLLVHLTNQLPATAAGTIVTRDVPTTVIGVVLVSIVAAATLAFLITKGSSPGGIFALLAAAGGLILTFGPALAVFGGLNSWQEWVSTAVVNAILSVVIGGSLYAVGRASTNANIAY